MKRNWTRRIALILLALWPTTAWAATKNEIVYVNLRGDGGASAVYVVNRFELEKREKIVDYGDYTAVVNLTDLSDIQSAAGAQTVTADAGTFFYQGTMAGARIPWVFTIRYALDGAAIEPEALAGRSGHVEIELGVSRDALVEGPYFDNYALSITATLDGERCANLTAEGMVIANAGKQKQINCTVLPGSERVYTISLDARDFEMSAISINAVPLSMAVDDVDTSSIKESVSELQDGIDELDSGAGKLNTATKKLKKGASTLYDGSKEVVAGLQSAKDGSALLSAGIDAAAGQINDLASGVTKLKNASGQLKSGGEQLKSGAKAIEKGCAELRKGCNALKSNGEAMASAIGALADAAASTRSDVSLLKKLLAKGRGNADVSRYLADELTALQKVLGTMDALDEGLASLSAQCAAYAKAIDEIASAAKELETAAGQLSSGVDAYVSPVLQLAEATKDFNAEQTAQQFGQLDAGMKKLDAGLATLKTRYGELHAGIKTLEEGATKLGGGTRSLEKGTGTLKDETSDMDATVDEKVDETLARYKGGDFEPVSFADARNEVTLVQFVMRTPTIEMEEADTAAVEEEAAPVGFWAKLRALF